MFQKVLVANRGEIAVRVIRTLRDMGIRSVAIYSDADRTAMHVRLADEAYPVGEAPSERSYLNIEAILEVCKASGAEAVHPGYGFLSENAAFAKACADAGLVFIGPSPEVIRTMGSKTEAREEMKRVGVPVVPGAHINSEDELQTAAQKLGFPVLIKAVAGGGGKGMRFVEKAEALADSFQTSAQ